jgi:vancomycin permeability regulator SanA
MRHWIWRGSKLLIIAAITGVLFLAAARAWVVWRARAYLTSPENAPPRRVAIVFGAGLWRDGSPTPVLQDRVATAAELYFHGKAQKLLFSGDNRFINYNEPEAMRRYALALGVPNDAIVLDYAGRRTYDTCYRARAIFGVQRALLVTQRFHLARALYTCRTLGIDALGLPADRRRYRTLPYLYWNGREVLASAKALLDLHLTHPLPVLGKPEPIFPEDNKP